MQESERNRLLRRADWRFLLHNPRPSKSIRYCDGTLRQAMEVLSPVMVTGDDDPRVSRNCDLAVVTDPNVATLRGAWSALRPGGSLYVEGHGFHSATRSWLRRQLRRSGFCEVRCFWPYPNPETFGTTWWVPLDNRAVLRYVLRQHLAMGEIEFRLQGVARRFLSGTFARPTPWPVCAVARNPIAAGAAPVAANGESADECDRSLREYLPAPRRELLTLLITRGLQSPRWTARIPQLIDTSN